MIDNAFELLEYCDEIDFEMKKLITDAIPDLISETPKTPIAIAKFKRGTKKLGAATLDGLKSIVIDVLSEAAKKALFPTQ